MSNSSAEDKRLNRLKLVDDHIGAHLRSSQASGELSAAPSYGKPLNFGDGYDETPAELRMGMKILKDAGVVPHEVEMMREVAQLQQQLAAAAGDAALEKALLQRITEKQQAIALRLEKLRMSGSL